MLKKITIGLCAIAVFSFLAPKVNAQNQTVVTQPIVSIPLLATRAVGTSAWFSLPAQPAYSQDVHYWTITWFADTTNGTIPTCQIKAQQAIVQASPSDLISDQTCTSTGTVSASVAASTNYVRIYLDTKTGNGMVSAVLNGYSQDPYGAINVNVIGGGGTNPCASTVGVAVPGIACATGVDVAGTLRRETGTNTTGTKYAADTNDLSIDSPKLANSLSNTAVTVKASAGTLDLYFCANSNTSDVFLQIFDISGSVTVGSSTPVLSFQIPGYTSGTGAGNMSKMNMGFANAIKVAATTTVTGGTGPSTPINCNFGYR